MKCELEFRYYMETIHDIFEIYTISLQKQM